MHEDFVSFSIAKKLKEKGYPQAEKNALAMYNKDSEWYSLSPTLDDFYYDFRDFDENDCVSPTISQVLKWLREEKGLSLNVYPSYFANLLYWTCDVISFIGEISIEKRLGGDVKTYEEAAIAGIEYVLDNLI
jgi:hypothetical protein